MSPILVRPVREQLEHDRVIRLLQAKLKRKHDVVMNIGEDQTVPVRIGQVQIFPDLVLTSVDRGKKLMGTVEVETAESVNHLEAMAQWVHFSRARVPFHLYVPVTGYDTARRLCEANGARPSEIWTSLSRGATGFALGAAAVVFAGRTWCRRADLTPNQLARLKWEQARAAAGAGAGAWREREVAVYSPRSDAVS